MEVGRLFVWRRAAGESKTQVRVVLELELRCRACKRFHTWTSDSHKRTDALLEFLLGVCSLEETWRAGDWFRLSAQERATVQTLSSVGEEALIAWLEEQREAR